MWQRFDTHAFIFSPPHLERNTFGASLKVQGLEKFVVGVQ